ncbi:hypothetical protein RRG08_056891 [Elysia crispata]|uniref:Uncharacterized protein n=1 Tax=Elysia crispata TaxID=231223 RepID=A0AAE0ZCB4_9GAST|nr:hypothetical protein RRG08_056891 [Elysia crispata]
MLAGVSTDRPSSRWDWPVHHGAPWCRPDATLVRGRGEEGRRPLWNHRVTSQAGRWAFDEADGRRSRSLARACEPNHGAPVWNLPASRKRLLQTAPSLPILW